jgi:hypothetical protein
MGSIPVVFFLRYGFLDELDFWSGTLGLVVISAIEVILFAWVFDIKRGWEEMHRGALIRVPPLFKFVIRYVTPIALILILTGWVYSDVLIGDKLTPKPAMLTAIVDRSQLAGDFSKKSPKDAAAVEHGKIKGAVLEAVNRSGRDLKLWATLDFDGTGAVRVPSVEGDPVLTAALPAPQLQRMLELESHSYVEGGKPKPLQTKLVIEGLYTRPYIWLARAMIAFILLGFMVMVGVIWRQRRHAEREPGTAPPRGDEPPRVQRQEETPDGEEAAS